MPPTWNDVSSYLDFQPDFSDPEVVSAYDELPLWSAMFGQMLLERVPMRRGLTVLDLGYGTGFPLLELAQRLGPASKVFGIDPWDAARQRAENKARLWQVSNVELLSGDAAAMPFPDRHFDLLVSNLGVNNFADPLAVLRECWRVARPSARLALTTNLQGHMHEFYQVFEATLREMGREDRLPALAAHVAHRATVAGLEDQFRQTGFRLAAHHLQTAVMRFADGSALLRHYFIRFGFLDGWKSVLEPAGQAAFFTCLETNLNRLAEARGELSLTIPMAYLEAEKVE